MPDDTMWTDEQQAVLERKHEREWRQSVDERLDRLFRHVEALEIKLTIMLATARKDSPLNPQPQQDDPR